MLAAVAFALKDRGVYASGRAARGTAWPPIDVTSGDFEAPYSLTDSAGEQAEAQAIDPAARKNAGDGKLPNRGISPPFTVPRLGSTKGGRAPPCLT